MEKLYDVQPGFDWVAGRRVPETRQVQLTDEAAEFDLLQGRIGLAGNSSPPEPVVVKKLTA